MGDQKQTFPKCTVAFATSKDEDEREAILVQQRGSRDKGVRDFCLEPA